MFIIYDLIFFVVAIIYFPVYLFRRKFHRGFISRLGVLPKDLRFDRPIWIHAVSVGEAMAMRGLIRRLSQAHPDKQIVISTVTATGNEVAKGIAGQSDFVTYLPLDFSVVVRQVIDKISPALFIIAETEIWPNLISCLYDKNIPVVVVNGRVSDNSFRGYLMIKFLLKPILNRISLFCVQTERDAERLSRLGVSQNKIKVTGNMKFDFKDYIDSGQRRAGYREKLGLNSEEKLWIAGSTHSGEEGMVLSVYKKLAGAGINLRLMIAPRHPERSKDIEKLIIKYNFQPLRISQINSLSARPRDPRPIFILDTVGQLVDYYAIADVVFVGGSLIKKGGHNILEPAAAGKPVLFGPYMFNFRDIAELFLENKAAILVHNEVELKEQVKYLLGNPMESDALSERAKELIQQNQGATQRNLELIQNLYARIPL